MKKLYFLLLVLAAGLAACSQPDTEPEPTLKIEVSECKIDPAAGSTATISFEVNNDWQTSVKYEEGDQEWLTIAPASGAAGKVDLTVTATGNTQSDARRAYVTITYGGDRSYKLAVVQAGLPDDPDPADPTLKIEVSECTIESAEGSAATVSFEVNNDWKAYVEYEGVDPDWLTIAPASGAAGKVDMTLTAAGNTRFKARRAYINIYYGGDESYELTVVQSGLSDSAFDPLFAQMLEERGYIADAKNITPEDVKEITELDVSGNDILTSLRGIEYFESLTYLNCSGNRLTSLDVSNNADLSMLICDSNGLTELDVSNNTALIQLECSYNDLTALDVSNNPWLMYLGCIYNQLTTLDVSKNNWLQILYCSMNQLSALDVSKNTALTQLQCDSNQLTSLDVSKNTELSDLNCGENQLTSLDLSKCTALTKLVCHKNQLTALDISNNTALTKLVCITNQLTSLVISNDTALTELDCGCNQLTSLDLSKCTALTELDCRGNQLTSLNVNPNTALSYLNCCENQLTALDISNNTALTHLVCNYNPGDGAVFPVTAWFDNNAIPLGFTAGSWDYDGATITIDYRKAGTPPSGITADFDPLFAQVLQERGYIADANNITLEEVKGITELDVTSGKLTSLRGIEYFESLTSLNCGDNQLTALDVSNNPALTDLWCYTNQLTALDISKNTSLSRLNCGSNQLTSLDVSKNIALTGLACSDNPLTALDVSSNTELKTLNCVDNRLTSLDISKNTAVIYLDCHSNRLSSLDVSNNTALIYLACEHNPGDGTVFPVTAWFDNNAIPLGFTAGSWDYDGAAITIDYQNRPAR